MAEPKRNRWGQYLITDPRDGVEKGWPRATTLSSSLEDTYNLARWEERKLIEGLGKRPDLIALAQATDPEDRKAFDRMAAAAKEAAGRSDAANLGTAIHKFAEQVDNGEKTLDELPTDQRETVRAYRKVLEDEGIEVVDAEVIVLNLEVGIAGTYDRLVRVPGNDTPVILDLKTGRSVDYSHLSHAAQLAEYANAEWRFNQETEKLEPAPPMDKQRGIIAHLPAGKAECTLYVLDLVKGWEAALVARQLYDLRKEKGLSREW